MSEHSPLSEIAQKIWEAAKAYQTETDRQFKALENGDSYREEFHGALPIIAPLVQELEKFVDDYGKLVLDAATAPDTVRLSWIEAQSNGMNWCARQSTTGRGFRLHNSEMRTNYRTHHRTAREAIDAAMFPTPLPFDGEDGG